MCAVLQGSWSFVELSAGQIVILMSSCEPRNVPRYVVKNEEKFSFDDHGGQNTVFVASACLVLEYSCVRYRVVT